MVAEVGERGGEGAAWGGGGGVRLEGFGLKLVEGWFLELQMSSLQTFLQVRVLSVVLAVPSEVGGGGRATGGKRLAASDTTRNETRRETKRQHTQRYLEAHLIVSAYEYETAAAEQNK